MSHPALGLYRSCLRAVAQFPNAGPLQTLVRRAFQNGKGERDEEKMKEMLVHARRSLSLLHTARKWSSEQRFVLSLSRTGAVLENNEDRLQKRRKNKLFRESEVATDRFLAEHVFRPCGVGLGLPLGEYIGKGKGKSG